MDVNKRNRLFLDGNWESEDLWPKITEYSEHSKTFAFDFGLDELPQEPGIILIRGPRQFGKSTWLELALKKTLEAYGKGSAYFLNGDEIASEMELESKLIELIPSFHPDVKVRRIFIDEITAIEKWEKALKRLADQGQIRKILIVTTGSKATDLRRGSERLPGRKGKLKRTEYIFTGVSYQGFHSKCSEQFREDTWIAYLLSGTSPVAAQEILRTGRIPEYFFELTRDWIFGEVAKSGRSRQFVISLMRALFSFGGSRVGYLNLAKASGMANNTIASEYIELFSDLLSIVPSFQWDHDKDVPLQRKPCKFHFVNLTVAHAFSPQKLADIESFKSLDASEKSKWLEWLVAQEIFRRQCVQGAQNPEAIWYWASKEHEIDFVDDSRRFYEVKHGNSDPFEFNWFPKIFPKKKLIVIGKNEFQNTFAKGVTIDQFLLSSNKGE